MNNWDTLVQKEYIMIGSEIEFEVVTSNSEFEELISMYPLYPDKKLLPFGLTLSGSVISILVGTKKSENASHQNYDSCPVVWLDSEGVPSGIITNDVYSFIRLVPYSMNLIYDIFSFNYFSIGQMKSNAGYLNQGILRKSIEERKLLLRSKLKKSCDDFLDEFDADLDENPFSTIRLSSKFIK